MKRIILVIMICAWRYIPLLALIFAVFAAPAQLPVTDSIQCTSAWKAKMVWHYSAPPYFRYDGNSREVWDKKTAAYHGVTNFQDRKISKDSSVYYYTIKNGQMAKIRLNRAGGADPLICADTLGNLFVTWLSAKGLIFQRSSDGGRSWLPQEKEIVTVKSGARYKAGNRMFYRNQSFLHDVSAGHCGRLYVCWSDTKYSSSDRDVFLAYSDDQGDNWTEPVLVTYRANHKAQFDEHLLIDSVGTIYIAYYDQQNYADGQFMDLYLAISNNGGLQFNQVKVNRYPISMTGRSRWNFIRLFDPGHPVIKWRQNTKGNYFMYEAAITARSLTDAYEKEALQRQTLQFPKTVSYSGKINLPLTLSKDMIITAVITKPLDPGFEKPVFTNKIFKKDTPSLTIDTKALGLEKGNYTLFLYYDQHNDFCWILGDE